MIKEVTTADARKNLGEILNEVKYCHDNVVITKKGKPVAAIIDVELFEKIKRLRSEFDLMSLELGKVYEDVDSQKAEKEIAEAITKTKSH